MSGELQADVVIIGGGLSGLACAVGLSGSGLAVTLVEASIELGGRARSWTDDVTGDIIDIGPHVITSEHRNMLRLLERLNTAAGIVWHTENFLVLAGSEVVVMKRYPLPAPLSLLPNLFSVRALSRRDLASNTRVVLFAMRLSEADVLRLDERNARDFLSEMGVTPRFIDWFWRTAAMTFMNVPLEQCSAGALLRVFRQLLGDNRFRFGFPGRGLGDLFVPGSVARIRAEGGRVFTQTRVQGLVYEAQRVTGVVLDTGAHIHTRFCVCAVTPAELRTLLPEPWTRAEPFRSLGAFVPVPYVSTYLWLDRKLTHEQMWTRLWSPQNLNYDFYDLSNIRPGKRRGPSIIAGNIIHSPRARDLSDQAVIQATLDEVADFSPQARAAVVRHARVHRIPMAIPAPLPGIERLRPDVRTPIPGLLLAGDWTNTGFPASMESAARSGFLAAEQIWAALGRPRQLTLPMVPSSGFARLLSRWPLSGSAGSGEA